jgi:hypothetical protein
MKKICLGIFLLIGCFTLNAQQEGQHDVYLFANLMDIEHYDTFLGSLQKEIEQNQNAFSIVVTGDLADSPSSSKISYAKKLMDITSKSPKGKLYLLAGDRDWNDSKEQGYANNLQLEKKIKTYIKENQLSNVKWVLKDACPGPFDIELDEHLLLVALNSQWWNHPFQKPKASDAICKYVNEQDIKEEFEDLLDENQNKNILIVTHHPFKSLGNYGGYFSFVDNLSPIPLIGSFKTAYHTNIGGVYDLSNENLSPFIELLTANAHTHENLIFASGHEQNQQVLSYNNNYMLNSGAVESSSFVARTKESLLSKRTGGIMKLSYKKSGEVDMAFLKNNATTNTLNDDWSKRLFTSACDLTKINEGFQENLMYIPCILPVTDLPNEVNQLNEYTQVAAGPQYMRSKFYRFWMGDHYRKDWSTPVEVPYLNIDTTFNGLSVLKKGGGRQTLSLKFEAADGSRYTFRSVDKDPSKALNYKLRTTLISKVFKDQTSTQHPYGALVVAHLLDSLEILHANPRLFRMPNVNALGPFQKIYGGMLGMLEENPGHKNQAGEHFAKADRILKSNRLFRELYEEKDHKVNVEEFIRARIFDILIGDWSKHEDNWKWAGFKTGKTTTYRPIPRDRDHAFSRWDGVLPSLADLPFGAPNSENFGMKIKGFKSLVYQARYMDRFLSTSADRSMYIEQAKYLQTHISDALIDKAVRQLPQSSFAISGKELADKLKQRKKDLVTYAQQYYEWLNEEVDLIGSIEDDYFEITINPDKSVMVKIFDEKQGNKGQKLFYDRTFYPGETKELRIYGLGEEDIFDVQGEMTSDILIRLLGGKEVDVYKSQTKHAEILVYDLDSLSQYNPESGFNFVDHWNTELYEYDRKRLGFNSWMPSVLLGYNVFNGVTLGIGNTWTNHRWDKKDYASIHHINVRGSTEGNFGLKYAGKWHHVFKKVDVLSDLSIANPQYFNAYYGSGNGTTLNQELDNNDFYVVNFNRYQALLGLNRDFWRNSNLSFHTGFEINSNKRIPNSILDVEEMEILGANEDLSVVPAILKLNIDFKDHPSLPYNGIAAEFSSANYWITNADNSYFGMLSATLNYFLSTRGAKKLTLGLKLEGTKGLGELPFYYQSLLGATTGLRGYTNNRFAGRSKLVFNSELRWELINNEEASIPIQMGILGFFDMGKVVNENDPLGDQTGYHQGYGFGIFLVPFSRSISFSLTFAFSDENSFYPGFSFGTALK